MPPTVTVTTAVVTEDSLEMTWSGDDADNDGLTFTVLYSPDQSTLQLLTLDTTETTLSLPLTDLVEPQTGAFIEVQANDGFNNTTVETSLVCQLVGTVTGDITGDGIISPADARQVMQQFLALVTPSLTLCQQAQGDVQQDGNLTPADSVCLLQIFLGLPSCRNF